MPYQRAADVLSEWRNVERALESVPVGTPEAEALQSEAARLRDEYRSMTLNHGWERSPAHTGVPVEAR